MNLKDKLSLIYANPFVSGIVLNSAGTLILLVLAVVLMKVLTVDEYGEFSLIYSIVTILAIIVTLGRDTGSVYYSKNYSLLGYKKNFFYEELLLTSLLSVLLVFILMLVGDEFVSFFNKNFDINLIITAFIIIPFWVAFNLLTSFLRSTSRYKSYFIWTGLYQRLSRLAFVVGFLYFVGGVESVLYGMILSQIFLVSTLTYLERDFFFTVKKINLKRFAFKFKYSFFLSIQSVTVILMEKVDVLTIGVLGTTSNVAVYSVAALVSTTLLLPYFVASKYIEPQLRKISGKMPRVEKKIVVYTTLVFLLGNLIFFILGANLFDYINSDYLASMDIVFILSIGYFFWILIGFPAEYLNMNGHSKLVFVVSLIALFLNIILSYIFFFIWGVNGVAYATITALIMSKLGFMYLRRTLS